MTIGTTRRDSTIADSECSSDAGVESDLTVDSFGAVVVLSATTASRVSARTKNTDRSSDGNWG